MQFFHADTRIADPVPDPAFPSRLSCWSHSSLDLTVRFNRETTAVCLDACDTHYGFVRSGQLQLTVGQQTYSLLSGMYFSVPGPCHLEGSGDGFVATRENYHGFFQLGGPVETRGRLQYIDGCSDSLLISPVVLGDPCLNLLYLPPNTRQTAHTHPSCRLGMIISGQGECRTPTDHWPLKPGMVFVLPPNQLHSFHTGDQELRVIAWHPDSDCGPHHQDHPMINRTMIQGVSAAELTKHPQGI